MKTTDPFILCHNMFHIFFYMHVPSKTIQYQAYISCQYPFKDILLENIRMCMVQYI